MTLLSKLPYLPNASMNCEPVAINDTFDCGGIAVQLTFGTETLPEESSAVMTIFHVETIPEGVLHFREELDVQKLARQSLEAIFNLGLTFKEQMVPNTVTNATADDCIANKPGGSSIGTPASSNKLPLNSNCRFKETATSRCPDSDLGVFLQVVDESDTQNNASKDDDDIRMFNEPDMIPKERETKWMS